MSMWPHFHIKRRTLSRLVIAVYKTNLPTASAVFFTIQASEYLGGLFLGSYSRAVGFSDLVLIRCIISGCMEWCIRSVLSTVLTSLTRRLPSLHPFQDWIEDQTMSVAGVWFAFVVEANERFVSVSLC
jgi:hypothetical protein